jgi:hypothetical protein
MKSPLLAVLVGSVALALPQMASATVLVGYTNFGASPDTSPNEVATAGLTSSFASGGTAGTLYGSVDGYYGPDGGVSTQPTQTDLSDGRVAIAHGAVFSVTNGTSTNYALGSLLFDMGGTGNPGGLSTFEGLTYSIFQGVTLLDSGDLLDDGRVKGANPSNPLTTITPGFGVIYPPAPGNNINLQDYSDFIADLSGLNLGLGERIEFTWNTGGPVMRLDNIALTAVPEPGSLLALGFLVSSGLFLRSRGRGRA